MSIEKFNVISKILNNLRLDINDPKGSKVAFNLSKLEIWLNII